MFYAQLSPLRIDINENPDNFESKVIKGCFDEMIGRKKKINHRTSDLGRL